MPPAKPQRSSGRTAPPAVRGGEAKGARRMGDVEGRLERIDQQVPGGSEAEDCRNIFQEEERVGGQVLHYEREVLPAAAKDNHLEALPRFRILKNY